jgi:hypothetical protein
MLLNFQDATLMCSPTDVRNLMFGAIGSIATFYAGASFGYLSFSGDVLGPFQINDARSRTCDVYGWADAADAAALAQGVDLSSYRHFVYVLARNPSYTCGWAGLGALGGEQVWIDYCDGLEDYAHELGHNLGMNHASTDPGDTGQIDHSQRDSEYGDCSDVMGNLGLGGCGFMGNFNGPHNVQMGWIGADKIVETSANGVFVLAPLSVSPLFPGAPMILKLPKPGTQDSYYFSYRLADELDSALSDTYADRISVHRYPGGEANTAFITSLTDGTSFTRPDGVTVTQLGHDDQSATVEVAFTCEPGAPSVQLSGTPLDTVPEVPGTLSVAVQNADNSKCSGTAFSIALDLPPGWSGSITPSALVLGPHQSGKYSVTIAPSATASDGSYPLAISVGHAGGPTVTLGAEYEVFSCKTPRCSVEVALTTGACAEGGVPQAIQRKLGLAVGLIERAQGSTSRREAGRLLRRASRVLRVTSHAVRRAAKGKRPGLTQACASALKDAIGSVQVAVSP